MENVVVWFEIPVKDLKRAMKFYSQVLGVELKQVEMGPMKMAMFPGDHKTVTGALVEGGFTPPCDKGVLIYLNGGNDLALPLSRVVSSGGKVVQEKMSIGEHGFIATLLDTEGNRVALHSMQ